MLHKQNINGHGILQLLVEKARLNKRKKLELIKKIVGCGVKIDIADKSGLTPFQVAVRNSTAEFLIFTSQSGKIALKCE